jgi:hypothetical protein
MPSYLDSFESEHDRWALVAYVLSLSPEKRPILPLARFKEKISRVLDANGIVRE